VTHIIEWQAVPQYLSELDQLTAWFVSATSTTPRNTRPKTQEKIQRVLRRLLFLRVSDRLAPTELSLGIEVS
jgi:hypothetical protein